MKKLITTLAVFGLFAGQAVAASAYSNAQNNYTAANNEPAATSDQALAGQIKNQLSSGFFSKGYEQVTFKVNNGNVTLNGAVATMSDKAKVEKAIRDIDGVRNLNSQLSVQNYTDADAENAIKFPQDIGATPSDKQLNLKIRDNVSNGLLWTSYKNVILNTADGVVTLDGFIDSQSGQQKLIDAIQNIEGVKSVNSNLTIKNH